MRRVYGRRSAECFFNPARCQSRRSDRGSTPLRSRHHHAHTRWNDFAAAVVMRAVPRRCLTDDLGEARAERPERSTADGDTGIGNGHSLPEKGLGALDATRHQIAVRGLAIGRTELAREVCGRHERRTRHRRDIERLCVLAVDEVACPTQMGQVGQFLRRHADNGMRRRRARTRFRRPRLRMLCSVQTQVGDPLAAGRRLRVLGAAIVAGLTAALLGLFEGFVGFTSVTPGASLATTCALVATMGLIALTLGWVLLRRQRHSVPVRVFVVGTVLFGAAAVWWTWSFAMPTAMRWDPGATSRAQAALRGIGEDKSVCANVKTGAIGPLEAPLPAVRDQRPAGVDGRIPRPLGRGRRVAFPRTRLQRCARGDVQWRVHAPISSVTGTPSRAIRLA